MRIATTPVAAAAALLLSGCLGSRLDTLSKQVTDLQQQLRELRKAQSGLNVSVEDLESRVMVVQDDIDTYRKRSAMALRRVQNLPVVRIKPAHGPNPVYDPSDDKPRPKREDPTVVGYDKLDDDGNVVHRGDGSKPTPPAGPKTPTPRVAGRPPAVERDAIQSYKAALEFFRQREYERAVAAFRAFVEKYPTHSHADNAMYWLGECYYARGLWTKALTSFQQVIQSYPLGNKVPDAMLKVGLCHQQLGNVSQAREVLRQLVDLYPKGSVADIARKRLEQIR